jgi:DNA-binding response OmpR family regulator
MIDHGLFRIGEFEIEPGSRRLSRRDGMTIHLASRPFQALLYLIVYEDSLTRCLNSVHQAIADRSRT